jgi:hypothetical protein
MLSAKFFSAVQRLVRQENPFRVASPGLGPANQPAPEAAANRAGLQVALGDQPGQWILTWTEANSSGGYELQTARDPEKFDLRSERTRHPAAKAALTVPAEQGAIWVRVRAIGLNGPGPWSDPVRVGDPGEALKQVA